jgi:hypothetical protein
MMGNFLSRRVSSDVVETSNVGEDFVRPADTSYLSMLWRPKKVETLSDMNVAALKL